MPKGLIAKKIGMSRVFLASGEAIPVTYLLVEPNVIVRTKTKERDGYDAVVLGVKPRVVRTRKGKEHTKYRFQKEWKVETLEGLLPGGEVKADAIPAESRVSVCGVSKGKGFQGVVKRYHFTRGPMSHGSHHHREPGSVGMREKPGRILKGKRMPGHMGARRHTEVGLKVVKVDAGRNLLFVRGAVPGPMRGILEVRKQGKRTRYA